MFTFLTFFKDTVANVGALLLPAPVYSPAPSAGLLSEHTSPVYPDRPIRPLPKKPLRSRLPPEVADSILYPPAPPTSRPLFYLPQNNPTHYADGPRVVLSKGEIEAGSRQIPPIIREQNKEGYKFKGNDFESDEEDETGIMRRYQEQRTARPTTQRNLTNGGARADIAKYPRAPNLLSTTSSADSGDGYDSFENTNNKKKRKIPTSGNPGNHHSSLSAEMTQMGIHHSLDSFDSAREADGGVSQYYGSGSSAVPAVSSGTGISGAGRGRFGRSGVRYSTARSPLGISTNGSNALTSTRSNLLRRDLTPSEALNGKGNTFLMAIMMTGLNL